MSIVHLSPVEQAYVTEIALTASAAHKNIEQQANAKLVVVLEAHGLQDANAQFVHRDGRWVLVLPDAPAAEPEAP